MNRIWCMWSLWVLFTGVLISVFGACATALAGERTFPAGSLVIPVDPCWQPAREQPAWTGCAADGSQAAVAGAYGIAYLLQHSGIPVYRAAAAEDEGVAFVIDGQGVAPVSEIPGDRRLNPSARSTPEGSLPASVIEYRGTPFLVDNRDLSAGALTVLARFPHVRRHQVLVPFVAPIARQLTGLPEQLRVADAAAVVRVQGLLALAGMNGSDGVSVVTEEGAYEPGARLDCTVDTPPAAPREGGCGLEAIFAALSSVPPATVSEETVQVAPVISAGTLYVASAGFPGRHGHLRAFALSGGAGGALWDAAEGIPGAGAALPSCAADGSLQPPFGESGGERRFFTNAGAEAGYRLLRFDSCAAATLVPQFGSASVEPATALIETVRGAPLGAITSSTPAVVGASPFVAAGLQRDRVLYVGSDAGILHAVSAGSTATGGGRELWGYLPGSLLPVLKRQPWGDATAFATARVDGSPAVSDQFADFDGDGRREWRTVLVGTASADGVAGVIFALDVTEPLQPRVLWERQLSGVGLGRSRGVAMTVPGRDGVRRPKVFLTGAPLQRRDAAGASALYSGRFGVLAAALDLIDGTLLWEFFAPYEGPAANLNAPPALPTLMSIDSKVHSVLFGDLVGRLWALDPVSGKPFGGDPVYRLAGGSSTPIATGVAVSGSTVLFASGGAEHVDPATPQALHAIELQPSAARQRWSVPLAVGEQPRGAPLLDRSGRVYVAAGNPRDAKGRLLVRDAAGTPVGAVPLEGLPGESLALAEGLAVTVGRQGTVEQLGVWRGAAASELPAGKVRILSWRFR